MSQSRSSKVNVIYVLRQLLPVVEDDIRHRYPELRTAVAENVQDRIAICESAFAAFEDVCMEPHVFKHRQLARPRFRTRGISKCSSAVLHEFCNRVYRTGHWGDSATGLAIQRSADAMYWKRAVRGDSWPPVNSLVPLLAIHPVVTIFSRYATNARLPFFRTHS